MNQSSLILPRYYTVKQTCVRINGSRSSVYRRLRDGDFRAVKRGRTTLIEPESVEDYLDRLPEMYSASEA